MNITTLRSDAVYRKIAAAPADKKDDIYRYEMMLPYKKKWDLFHIPLKAEKAGGYDIIMASGMLGYLVPQKIDSSRLHDIEKLSSQVMWDDCAKSVKTSLERFSKHGIELRIGDYIFTVLLADETSPYISMSDGYSGDGGIPGYITAVLTPNEFTLSRLPVALAHEANHNVRYQFIQWTAGVTLGEMLVSEGLAENFATSYFGEDKAGPWVTKTEIEWHNDYIKPIIHDGLGVQGLNELNSYLYGDEMAALQGCAPVGLPYCAGYACGYYLIKHYLRKTGTPIEQATILPASEILAAADDFWTTKTVK